MTHLLHRMDRSIHYVLPFLLFFLLAFNGLPAQSDLTPDQRSAVRAIANYTNQGADDLTQRLQRMGYTPPAGLEREWRSYPAARKLDMAYQAAERAGQGNGQRLINQLSKELADKYEGARYEPAFQSLDPDDANSHKPVKFKHPRKYGAPKLSQKTVKQIMAISKYTEAGALGAITQIRYVEEPSGEDQPASGYLEIYLDSGRELALPAVYAEDLLAAHRLIYGKEPGLEEKFYYEEGNAIGLIGIKNNILYPDSSIRWEVVVHPAIAETELGWSTLLADALPIANREILDLMEQQEISEEEQLLARYFFLMGLPSTWKVMDVPLTISSKDNQLRFQRSDLPAEDNIEGAYLTMMGFYENEESPRETEAFYALMPAITRSVYEYERLNNFVRVLATLRWAYRSDARIIGLPEANPVKPVPETVFITSENRIGFRNTGEEQMFFNTMLDSILSRMSNQAVASEKKDLIRLQRNTETLYELARREQEAYWTTDALCALTISGSDSLFLASQRYEGLRTGSPVLTLDSTLLDQEENRRMIGQIELARAILIGRMDSLLSIESPEDHARFRAQLTIVVDEEAEEAARDAALEKIDQILAENYSEYSTMLFFREIFMTSYEENQQYLDNLTEEARPQLEWYSAYQQLVDILNKEIEVLQALQQQRCEE